MADLQCPTILENFINDFDLFKDGLEADDVTLSDGHIMNSYRKFAVGELDRVGKDWSSIKTYLEDDIVSRNQKLFVALNDNINKDPEVSDWKEIVKDGVTEGTGISAFVTFNIQNYSVLYSKEVESVSSISTDTFEITVSDKVRVGAGNKLVYAISHTSEDIEQGTIVAKDPVDGVFKYYIFGRTIINEDNKIRISFNKEFVDWNAKFDVIILEV